MVGLTELEDHVEHCNRQGKRVNAIHPAFTGEKIP